MRRCGVQVIAHAAQTQMTRRWQARIVRGVRCDGARCARADASRGAGGPPGEPPRGWRQTVSAGCSCLYLAASTAASTAVPARGAASVYDWRLPTPSRQEVSAGCGCQYKQARLVLRLPLLAYIVPRGAARAPPLYEPTWLGGTAAHRESQPLDPHLPALRSGRLPLCAPSCQRVVLATWHFIHLNQRGGQGIESEFLLLGGTG